MIRFICYILFWCIYFPAQAQDIAYRQLREGRESPLVEVYGRIVQDSSGFIWAGGERGLFRFDGAEWKSYPLEEGILDVECLNLSLSKYQQLWYTNASEQICYLAADGDLIRAPLKDIAWPPLKTRYFTLNEDQVHFSASIGGLTSMSYFSLIPSETEDGYIIMPLLELDRPAHSGSLAIDSLGQLYYIKQYDSEVELWKNKEGVDTLLGRLHEEYNFSATLSQTELGSENIFFFNQHSPEKIYHLSSDGLTPVSLWNSSNHIEVYNVYGDQSHNYWFMTNQGIFGFDSHLIPIDTSENLASEFVVHNLFQDRDGAYWLGTKRNGILFVPNINTRRYLANNSHLKSDQISLLTSGPNGTFLAAGVDGNVYLFKGGKIVDRIYLGGDGGHSNYFTYLNYENGRIDVGGARHANFELQIAGNNLKLIRTYDFSPGVLGLYRDSLSGGFFAGYSEGMCVYKPEKKLFHNKRSAVLCRDKFRDKLWVGSYYGLGYLELGPETTSELKMLPFPFYVTDIAQTSDGLIWVGTSGQGVYSLDSNQIIRQYLKEDGLINNNCRKLFVDDHDNVWVASDEGVSRIDPNSDSITVVGERHGLLNEIVHCLYVDSVYLWAGTDGGLYQIPLGEIDRVYSPLQSPVIDSFNVNDERKFAADGLDFNYKEKNVVIDYHCLSFLDQKKLRYRYRLIGLDTSWLTVDATTTTINYPSLNPGSYRFELAAFRTDSEAVSAVRTFSFNILKPIWRRNWFLILLLLGIVAATAILSGYIRRLRFERLLKNQSYEQRISNLRTKALRLQMNPHFVYNTMNAVFLAQMDRDRKAALRIINRYGQLFRSVFEHAERDTIDLREEIDFLTIYIEMEELRFGDRINVQFNVSEELKISNAQIPPMLIQPLIENAFKHGLFHKEGEGKLEVSIRLEADVLTVEVSDDGVGRKYAQKMSTRKRADRSVSSETILRERIALINEKVSFSNSRKIQFEVKDLLSIDGVPTGTLAQLKIPLN